MSFYYYISIFSLFINVFPLTALPTKAVTQVPIADLLGDSKIKPFKNSETDYNTIPLCSQRLSDCLRVHQLLFNEIVTILEERGSEVLIQIPSAYYEDIAGKNNTFWALKKNFISFNSLSSLKISEDYFPDSYEYGKKILKQKPIVALLFPFYEPKTKQLFSVGTRFTLDATKNNNNNYCVYLFDAKNKRLITTMIPTKLCYKEQNNKKYSQQIQDFIKIMRSWIQAKGSIAYVWGGCSFTRHYAHEPIKIDSEGNYVRQDCKQNPKNGFDCTGLILRAAQICGLPYCFKNSTTILKNLDPLQKNNSLRNGDLIWIPGHVMVVADVAKNTLIEARGYSHGFGKVHEIGLDKVFYGIRSFDQLVECYRSGKMLQRIDSKGAIVNKIDNFKLLSMESIIMKKF